MGVGTLYNYCTFSTYYDVTKHVTDSPRCSEDAERYHREETSLTAKTGSSFLPVRKRVSYGDGYESKEKRDIQEADTMYSLHFKMF